MIRIQLHFVQETHNLRYPTMPDFNLLESFIVI